VLFGRRVRDGQVVCVETTAVELELVTIDTELPRVDLIRKLVSQPDGRSEELESTNSPDPRDLQG